MYALLGEGGPGVCLVLLFPLRFAVLSIFFKFFFFALFGFMVAGDVVV